VDLANMAEANRLVIQDMPDGVLVVDGQGVVRQCNPSAERLLGYSFPVSVNVTLTECSPFLASQFAAWKQSSGQKLEVLRLPGTHHWARVRFLPVQHEEFWGAVVFLEDMQRVQAQAQQIKLAALGRLTANIAHEVRNPLTSISYATELLQEGPHDPSQERLFQIILDNAARLNRIVQDVMQLNQRDRVHTEPLQLPELLRGFITNLCQTEHVTQDIFYIESIALCTVHFDRGHLDQVLWNLCRNALRYCHKNTRSVTLGIRHTDEGLIVLDITNDGPAVAPEVLHKLFEPFFTTSVGGTGLGLYIARELCEANGAALGYLPSVSGGVCFRIVFGERDER
jgi:two-component system sensor histidine kinase PilS (NtrC family)